MDKIRIPIIFLLLLTNYTEIIAQEDILWKFKTNNRIYSTPLVVDDMVYFGSGDNKIYAINKKTGEKVWDFLTNGEVHSSPTIINDLICFASKDGNLYGLNKTNGNLIWTFRSKGEKMYGLWDYYLSSPRSDGNTIYWGSGDNNLYAINSINGKLKWKFETNGIIHASPVIYNDKIYIGSFDGSFYCVSKNDGSLVWDFKTVGAAYFPKGEIQKAALIDNDIVYFGSRDYNLYALNANTGTGVWNMKQPRGWIIATPTEYKGNIYFGTSDAHKFYSINKLSGETNWTVPLNMRVFGTAIVHKDLIYFGTFDGKVLGVDYLSGEIKWEFQTKKSKENYSLIYNEKGEFKKDFVLYGKDYLESEKMIHSLGSILSSPVIDNDVIYFGSSDGNLYAVKIK
jgi:outer membrane protein assembly factor BamB